MVGNLTHPTSHRTNALTYFQISPNAGLSMRIGHTRPISPRSSKVLHSDSPKKLCSCSTGLTPWPTSYVFHSYGPTANQCWDTIIADLGRTTTCMGQQSIPSICLRCYQFISFSKKYWARRCVWIGLDLRPECHSETWRRVLSNECQDQWQREFSHLQRYIHTDYF